MKCTHCGKEVYFDLEQDLVHLHLKDKGVDDRMCEPSNPESELAKIRSTVSSNDKRRMKK